MMFVIIFHDEEIAEDFDREMTTKNFGEKVTKTFVIATKIIFRDFIADDIENETENDIEDVAEEIKIKVIKIFDFFA